MNPPKTFILLNTPDLVIVGAVDGSSKPQTLVASSPSGAIDLGKTKLHTAVKGLPKVKRTTFVPKSKDADDSMVVHLVRRLDKNSNDMAELVMAIKGALTGR